MVGWEINIIFKLQKQQHFISAVWYGVNMFIPDKVIISWKYQKAVLISRDLFNKCRWLETFTSNDEKNVN